MNSSRLLLSLALAGATMPAHAASVLRLYCEGDNSGARIQVNGSPRGSCPGDLFLPAGNYRIQAIKEVDAEHERTFAADITLGNDEVQRLEVQLSAPALTVAAAQKRAETAQREERARRQKAMEEEFARAGQGDIDAIRSVIRRYQQGDGVARSEALVADWTQRLKLRQQAVAAETRQQAEAGNADAMAELARMYRLGEGLEQDFVQALAWDKKAHLAKSNAAARAQAQEKLANYHLFPIAWKMSEGLRQLPKDPDPVSLTPLLIMSPIIVVGMGFTTIGGLVDAGALSFRLPEYNRLKKAAAGHAAAWQSPDSLIARAQAVAVAGRPHAD